ncbi:MAG: PspC domain-containing protein [Bacteroidetes bacterium]|jgi:phage shock protein C|nr:PspC domain-containing protein [Bacteroidota bacterium]MBU1577967.1 PspC domain-containing protein [Bacteroidota bacterium]MBU2465968.1 PspC domain-containing protein [Bacteroidota bacterium]MDA3942235.1 PspC domain-containing protein [Bacteroidota bacterium]
MNQVKRLFRSRSNRVIGGVCYGMANYINLDATIVRLLWVLFTLLGGAGLLAYLICWIIIPEEP